MNEGALWENEVWDAASASWRPAAVHYCTVSGRPHMPPDTSAGWTTHAWVEHAGTRRRKWSMEPTTTADDSGWELLSVSPSSQLSFSTMLLPVATSWSERLLRAIRSPSAAAALPTDERVRRYRALMKWINAETHVVFQLPLMQRNYHVALLRDLETAQGDTFPPPPSLDRSPSGSSQTRPGLRSLLCWTSIASTWPQSGSTCGTGAAACPSCTAWHLICTARCRRCWPRACLTQRSM